MRAQATRRALMALLGFGAGGAMFAAPEDAEAIPLPASALGKRLGRQAERAIAEMERKGMSASEIWQATAAQFGVPGERYRGRVLFEFPDDDFRVTRGAGRGRVRDFVEHPFLPERIMNMRAALLNDLAGPNALGYYQPFAPPWAPSLVVGSGMSRTRPETMLHELTHAAFDGDMTALRNYLRSPWNETAAAETRAEQAALAHRFSAGERLRMPFSVRERDPRIVADMRRMERHASLTLARHAKATNADVAQAELAKFKAQIDIHAIRESGKHLVITIQKKGGGPRDRATITVSKSPSDARSSKNLVSHIRKTLRRLGISA